MGTLSKCIATMGKALDETDRRMVLSQYEAHIKDGMPASDAAELAIREAHASVTDGIQQVLERAAAVGINVSMVDDDGPAEQGGAKPTPGEQGAIEAENQRAVEATPFGFAAIILKHLGLLDAVYRAPAIPKSAKKIRAAVQIGIPDAVFVKVEGDEDSMAGINSPEAAASRNPMAQVAEDVKYLAYTFRIPSVRVTPDSIAQALAEAGVASNIIERAKGAVARAIKAAGEVARPDIGTALLDSGVPTEVARKLVTSAGRARDAEFTIKEYQESPNQPDGAIEVDVSAFGTGKNGALVYNVAAGYAAAVGKPFRADSAGLKTFGAIRRTVTMANAAMRYGVQFVEPGEKQVKPPQLMRNAGIAPLNWDMRGLGVSQRAANANESRNERNFANLLQAEMLSVRQALGNMVDQYGFDWTQGTFTKDGEPVAFGPVSADVAAMVESGRKKLDEQGIYPENPVAPGSVTDAGRASPPYGRASIARAVLVQSLARTSGAEGRLAILDAARQLSSGRADVPSDLLSLWSKAGTERGGAVKGAARSMQEAVNRLKASWGAVVEQLQKAGRLRVVSRQELFDLLAADQAQGGKTDPNEANDAKGVFWKGTAYVVWDNQAIAELPGTLLHEAGVHMALRKVLGEDAWQALKRKVLAEARAANADPALKAARDAVPENTPARLVAEETVAYLSEQNPGHGIVTRVLDMLKGALNAMGFDIKSESDNALLLRVIRDGLRAEASGKLRNTVNDPAIYRSAADRITAGDEQKREATRTGREHVNAQVAAVDAPMYSKAAKTPWAYSALAAAVQRGKNAPKSADAAGWGRWLDKASFAGEFKKNERLWLGIDQWLSSRGQTTRDELIAYVGANQVQIIEAVFGQDAGATNARQDRLDMLAERDFGRPWAELDREDRDYLLQDYDIGPEPESNSQTKFDAYQLPGGSNYRELAIMLPLDPDGPEFLPPPSHAFAEGGNRNRVLHVRFNERTDADGKRVLFVEEIQSDWHQDGKKKGYVGSVGLDQLRPVERKAGWMVADGRGDTFNDRLYETQRAAQAFIDAHNTRNPPAAVPDAPFREEWPLLGMKRMIRWAAENGFDRVAWTTGDQQTDRYGNIDGNLETRRRGMREFYDNKLRGQVDKFVRPLGGSVGQTAIDTGQGGPVYTVRDRGDRAELRWQVTASDARGTPPATPFATEGEAKAAASALNMEVQTKVPSIEITPQMQEAALDGFPMWSKRTPGQQSAMAKAGVPVDERGIVQRAVDAVRAEWDKVVASWYGGTDERIQAMFDRFRGIGAAEEAIERAIGRTLDANERSYVMARMNLGLPSIIDALLTHGVPRWEDQTWTQWGSVVLADGTTIEDTAEAPSRPEAADALRAKHPGLQVTMIPRPSKPVAGLPEKSGMSGGVHGVFVRNDQTVGLLEALRPVADDINGWLGWMVAQRAKVLTNEGRENLLSVAEIAALDSLADTPEKLAAFQQAAKEYVKIKTAVLDMAEQAGIISREGREYWDHAEYLPFFRQGGEGQTEGPQVRKRMTDVRPGIKTLVGGTQILADPLSNIIRNFTKLIDASMKNVALQRMVTNLSLSLANTQAIADTLRNKNVSETQIRRAFARVGLMDSTGKLIEQADTEVSRADLRRALLDASVDHWAVNAALGMKAADSAFFEKMELQPTRALVPMSAVVEQLLADGVPQAVIDSMPPAALRGLRNIMAYKMPTAPNIFTVMRNGKPESYRTDDPLLLRSLLAMQPQTRNLVINTMAWFSRTLTGLVTRDPFFMVRNFQRDVVQNWVIAEVPYNPIMGALKGISRSFTESGGAIDMMFAGASFHRGHAAVHDPDATATAIRLALLRNGLTAAQATAGVAQFMSTIVDIGARGVEGWNRVGSAVENASREAIYEAAIRAGRSRAEAHYMARDVMDFGLRGDSGLINLMADTLPFFNARLQGMYKLYRSGAVPLPGLKYKLRTAVVMRGLVLTAFSGALMAMNMALFAAGYDALEEWDKDMYWHLAPGTIFHTRIPKPFEIGLIFGTIPERIYRSLSGADSARQSVAAMGHAFWQTLGLNPIPQAILPIYEVANNVNSFTGRPIESLGDQGLPPAEQREWYTSNTAALAADAVNAPVQALWGDHVGVSSKQVEHLWKGYTGTIGGYALAVADILVDGMIDSPTRADDTSDWISSLTPQDIGVGRSTVPFSEMSLENWREGGAPRNTRFAGEFYDLLNEVTVVSKGIKAKLERAAALDAAGQPERAQAERERAEEMTADNAQLLGETIAKPNDKRVTAGLQFGHMIEMQRATRELRALREKVEIVMTDPKMSAVDQGREVRELSRQRNEILQTMVEAIRNPPE